MSTSTEGFGLYLRDLRAQAGLSQRQLGGTCEIDFSYISKLENGRLEHLPSPRILAALAAALEVDELEMLARAGRLAEPLASLSREPQALGVLRLATKTISDARGWETLREYLESDAFADALANPNGPRNEATEHEHQ